MKSSKLQAPSSREAPTFKSQILVRSAGRAAAGLIVFLGFELGTFRHSVLHAAAEPPYGIDHRIPWTTSRVIGSPDPPLPYTVEKTFTNIHWRAPIFLAADPDADRMFVVLAGGESDR